MTSQVDHEIGAIRFIVDSSLSSKVAKFNKQVNQHQESQLLNPFTENGDRRSPRRTFSKDEYGKPLAGSLTEMRGIKANCHVFREMLELCQIIDSEGFPQSRTQQELKVISFGDLFNIYTHISDKVVGLLLRARKHKLLDFEGEMLFQRRDDDVMIYLLKPIKEIRAIMESKQEEIRRSASPAPQPTTVIQDNLARKSVSPSPATTPRSVSPAPQIKPALAINDDKIEPKEIKPEPQALENVQEKNEPSEEVAKENAATAQQTATVTQEKIEHENVNLISQPEIVIDNVKSVQESVTEESSELKHAAEEIPQSTECQEKITIEEPQVTSTEENLASQSETELKESTTSAENASVSNEANLPEVKVQKEEATLQQTVTIENSLPTTADN